MTYLGVESREAAAANHKARLEVILEVCPNSLEFMLHSDARGLQPLTSSDPGPLQNGR
jgi:hypothetical protein